MSNRPEAIGALVESWRRGAFVSRVPARQWAATERWLEDHVSMYVAVPLPGGAWQLFCPQRLGLSACDAEGHMTSTEAADLARHSLMHYDRPCAVSDEALGQMTRHAAA